MEVYIDKENLRSFIRARNDSRYKDCYDDYCRMLKRQLHINYNFAKTQDLLKDEELMNYFMLSGQGNGDSEADTYSTEVFPYRHVGMSTPRSFNRKHSSAVYLIDDEGVDSFREVGTSLVGDVNEEIAVLKRLFCGNDYDFHKLYNLQDRNSFSDWQQIRRDKLNLPLSDIIIMDRYSGAFPQNAGRNLYKLIEILVENASSKVNVLIICDKTYVNGKKEKVGIDTTEITESIIDLVFKKTSVEPNVTMVVNPSNEEIKEGVRNKKIRNNDKKILSHPHDRLIFTNYILFRSGDSFYNYFDENGQIKTEGTALDVNSLAKKSNYDFAMSIIDDIQIRCDKISHYFPDHIIGDKKSNYINFQ